MGLDGELVAWESGRLRTSGSSNASPAVGPVRWRRRARGRRRPAQAARHGWTCRVPPGVRSSGTRTPPAIRTWSRRGHTPVVRVRGRSRRRLSVAALACYKAGKRSPLIYRPARTPGQTDACGLIQTAHRQLGGPVVLVSDPTINPVKGILPPVPATVTTSRMKVSNTPPAISRCRGTRVRWGTGRPGTVRTAPGK